MQLSRQVAFELARAEFWVPRATRVAGILVGAWILTFVAARLLRKLKAYAIRSMDRHGHLSPIELENRATTLISVLVKIVNVVVWLIALVMALNELTFNIQPLLAGLGVAGLAVGLGAQTLIKDWIGGILVLLEDQIRIGDYVTINAVSGVVEEINLRTTVLRGENGALHYIPNGSITALANMTREYAFYVMEIVLARGSNADTAIKVLTAAADETKADQQLGDWILGKIEILSVDRLSPRGVVIRARIKTSPGKQTPVGLDLNRRVNDGLAKEGLEFPPLPAV